MSGSPDVLLAANNETGEGPVWDEIARVLWWTDIPAKRLYRFDPATAQHRIYDLPGRVGCFALRRERGLILAMEHGFATWDPESDALTAMDEPERGMPGHRFNDGRCDRQGRFLAGSMNTMRSGPTGQLWRLDPDGATTRIAGDVTVANGLAFSPDGKLMYWADSPAEHIDLFDYDPATGRASNRRVWLGKGDAPGRPDGGTIDAEGCYWSARWLGGSVVRFTPAGTIDRIIHVPVSRVTMCAFGGADLRTLYITSAREGMTPDEIAREPLAGAVFAIQVPVQGLPEPRFAG